MQERTHSQEAAFNLANLFDWVSSSYMHLFQMMNINKLNGCVPILLISSEFKNRLLFNIERAPLNSEFTIRGYKIIRNHNFRNALTLFPTDIPQLSIWRNFDNFLCAVLLSSIDGLLELPVHSMVATRGQDIVDITLGQSVNILRTVLHGHRHCCDDNALFKILIPNKEITSRQVNLAKQTCRYQNIQNGKAFHCSTCGQESIYFATNLKKISRLYNVFVGANRHYII